MPNGDGVTPLYSVERQEQTVDAVGNSFEDAMRIYAVTSSGVEFNITVPMRAYPDAVPTLLQERAESIERVQGLIG